MRKSTAVTSVMLDSDDLVANTTRTRGSKKCMQNEKEEVSW